MLGCVLLRSDTRMILLERDQGLGELLHASQNLVSDDGARVGAEQSRTHLATHELEHLRQALRLLERLFLDVPEAAE